MDGVATVVVPVAETVAMIEEEPRSPITAPLSRQVRRSHDLGVPMPRNGDRWRTNWIT
jgi:hypothetical protein